MNKLLEVAHFNLIKPLFTTCSAFASVVSLFFKTTFPLTNTLAFIWFFS
jgi:hypothetical protein